MSFEEKIKEVFTELDCELHRILDELERGCFKRQLDVFDDVVSEVASAEQKTLALLKDQVVVPKQKLDDLMTKIKEEMRWNTERLRADDEPKSERRISVLSARIDTLEWILKKLGELHE